MHYAILIGRFQPIHAGHLSLIRQALADFNQLIIVIGSAHKPRNSKDPFTAPEREAFILTAIQTELGEAAAAKVRCVYVEDQLYNDQHWIATVTAAVEAASTQQDLFTLIGYHKDPSSYYLKVFPHWQSRLYPPSDSADATAIRSAWFSGKLSSLNQPALHKELGLLPSVYQNLEQFSSTQADDFARLVREHTVISQYKKQWEISPYPPTFVTADAIVIQAGHILLIKRKSAPGEGLYALPGGFLEQNETLEAAAMRELREETRLKVPPAVLKGSIKAEKMFDAPLRSLRGRTLTMAFLFKLDDQQALPSVKGSDDAEHALWVPLHRFKEMQEQLFEDHFHIANWGIDLSGSA